MHAVEEVASRSKQLQAIVGVSPVAYWTARWLWDFGQFCAAGVGTFIIIWFGTSHSYHVRDRLVCCV